MIAVFNIVDCCGDLVDTYEMELSENSDPQSYLDEAFERSGYQARVEPCEACNSSNYAIQFAYIKDYPPQS